MPTSPRLHYAAHLKRVNDLMVAELAHSSWDAVPQLQALARKHLAREGKQLRPLLTLLFADLFDGDLARAYPAAAAIETYHTASLIVDDIQDNSEFRRGLPCVHVTTSTSTAMNLAGTVRALMYPILYRSPKLTQEEQLYIHQRIDEMAAVVPRGQSIDIGWHEGWYPDYQSFPYDQMIRWKSAAIFGCAAHLGAFLGKSNEADVRHAEDMGVELGVLFQMVDDYLDIFGDPVTMRRPLFNDFREGKVTYPVIALLDRLSAASDDTMVARMLESLAERNALRQDWRWLVQLMNEHDVPGGLLLVFARKAQHARQNIAALGPKNKAKVRVQSFLDQVLAHVPIQETERAALSGDVRCSPGTLRSDAL